MEDMFGEIRKIFMQNEIEMKSRKQYDTLLRNSIKRVEKNVSVQAMKNTSKKRVPRKETA
jgi:hypothetical protein